MMVLFPFLALFLIQTSSAFLEDSYPETADGYSSYPEDYLDADNDVDMHKRNNHFLRFGRNNVKNDNDVVSYEDYEEFARPTRKTEKNDYFIRFGRGRQQDYLRFGRTPARAKGNYIRFGRSIPEIENPKKRSKREAFTDDLSKRSDSFLRFGRNSNFMRFGRDPSSLFSIPNESMNTNQLPSQLHEPTLIHLLAQLLAHKQDENKTCQKA